MAEMTTSNSIQSDKCSPPTKKARMESTADPFKSVGSLAFRIDNFREFSKRPPGETNSRRYCDAKVIVRGLTFRLAVRTVRCKTMADPTQKCMGMGVLVRCENASGYNVEGDGSWSCLASITQRIKPLIISSGKDDDFYEYTHEFFSSKDKSSLVWEDDLPWRFEYLIHPENGLYNEKEDTLELIVEISVDAPVGVMELPKTNTIQVNQQTVYVNKNLLAAHSSYFHSLFYNGQFDEGKTGVYEVEIGAPATVEHFRRMLQTMYPEKRPLDDDCIEGVLHLANQFLVTVVEGKCLKFLTEESKKPALFKYRVADKYGYTVLLKHVLRNLKVTDFKDNLFMANLAECVQLGSDAAEALKTRYNRLFPHESDE